MKKHSVFLFCITSSLFSMDTTHNLILVYASDGVSTLSKSTIYASNRLLKKHLSKQNSKAENTDLFFPSVTTQELLLFENAAQKKPNELTDYFTSLTTEQQQTLITIAGKRDDKQMKMLNAKHLTAQLIDIFFISDIKDIIIEHIPMKPIIHYLRHKIITKNYATKNISKQKISCPKELTYYNPEGTFHYIPALVKNEKDNTIRYTGNLGTTHEDSEGKIILYGKENKNKTAQYTITHHPLSKNKINLWLKRKDLYFQRLIHTIDHRSTIDTTGCKFDENGNYLITQSYIGTITLTKLGTNTDGSDCSSTTFSFDHTIKDVCFNQLGTLVAAAGADTIYLWKTKNGKLLHQFTKPNPLYSITKLFFTKDNTTLAAISYDQVHNKAIELLLWNTQNFHTNYIELDNNYSFIAQHFDAHHNMLLIVGQSPFLDQASIVIIDCTLGKIIHTIKHKIFHSDDHSLALCLNYDGTLLAIARTLNEKAGPFARSCSEECISHLYHIPSESLIAVLANYQNNITGIGFTPNDRTVITHFNNCTYMRSTFCRRDASYCLAWLKEHPTFLQRYLLYNLYRQTRNKQPIRLNKNHIISHIISTLPTLPHNIQETIKEYFAVIYHD